MVYTETHKKIISPGRLFSPGRLTCFWREDTVPSAQIYTKKALSGWRFFIKKTIVIYSLICYYKFVNKISSSMKKEAFTYVLF